MKGKHQGQGRQDSLDYRLDALGANSNFMYILEELRL